MWNLYKIVHIPQKTQNIPQIVLKKGNFQRKIILNYSSKKLFHQIKNYHPHNDIYRKSPHRPSGIIR